MINFSRNEIILHFHDDFQPMHQLTAFQFIKINDGDAKLGGAVPRGGSADFGCDNDGFCAFSAEAITQDRKFVQCLCLDIAGLAADKQRNNTASSHNVDLIQNAAVT